MTVTQEIEIDHTPVLSAKGRAALDELLATRVDSRAIPAATFGATTADGEIYLNCRGERVFGQPDKGRVDDKTVFQLYSMTKLVTVVAVLQQCERGVVSLDDHAVLEKYCPDLCAMEVLVSVEESNISSTPRTAPLTLRRLLTHTSGLAYWFTNKLLGEWVKSTNHPGHLHGDASGYLEPPVYQPGETWVYGIGIDWAAICIERATGKRLDEIFQENVFAPLGLTPEDITFTPTQAIRDNWQHVCGRDDNGELKLVDPLRPLDGSGLGQLSGGGGLLGTARAYLTFLRGVLASARPGGLLSPDSFNELFTDSLDRTDSVLSGLGRMGSRVGYHDPEHVENNAQGLGHSVGLCLNLKDSVHGRRAGSGCWDGMAKTHYWLDPVTGVAVSIP